MVKVVVAAPAQGWVETADFNVSDIVAPKLISAACTPHPETGSCLARRGRTISHVVHTRARTTARGCSPRKPVSDRVCASTRAATPR